MAFDFAQAERGGVDVRAGENPSQTLIPFRRIPAYRPFTIDG
ncbi:hypothetical protein SUS17_3959 [Sphingomonas sp. S17]|nr:hypothetical protein SUS17_3959 [Sphingomonas sp. S17]